MSGSMEQQIIRREVEEKLKDFAKQIGLKFAEYQQFIDLVFKAIEATDARLTKLEEARKIDELSRDGKEL